MLQRSLPRLAMSVGVACRTMGFSAPPRDKKELKKRFLALAKEHHPDQNADTEAAATHKMIQVTEAYKTLKELLDTGVHAKDMHGAISDMQRRRAGGEAAAGEDPSMQEVAASFVAPGSSLSLRDFTLPWQRAASRSRSARMMEQLDKAKDIGFGDYVSAVRAVEKERGHREEAVRRDAPLAQGSHGFTADYFAQLHAAKQSFSRGNGGAKGDGNGNGNGNGAEGREEGGGIGAKLPTGVVPLACRFYGRRFLDAARNTPRRSWHAMRYVVFGH